jgi:hypothetical protein
VAGKRQSHQFDSVGKLTTSRWQQNGKTKTFKLLQHGEIAVGAVEYLTAFKLSNIQGTGTMNARTLRAHFDGSQIRLDEPFELSPNTELLITVLPAGPSEESRDWGRIARDSLAMVYGEDEPEYSRDLIREANPEYEGR